MTTNKTWQRLTALRAEVLALLASIRDGTATLPDDVLRLESLARPHGRRHEIEKLIGGGHTDAEIVKALKVKKQQVNKIRNQLKTKGES